MAEDMFLVRGDDDVEYGPVSLAELREWVAENRAGLGTSVKVSPNGAWNEWQHYPELVALLAEVRATGGLPAGIPVVAPLGRRCLALILDLILASILVAPPLIVLYWMQPAELIIEQQTFLHQFLDAVAQGATPPDNMPPSTTAFVVEGKLLNFVLPLLYFAAFHSAHGRTPAKSVLHLEVVDAAGRKPSFQMALLRALVLMVSVNLFGIPLLYAFVNPQRRALHDIVAGTFVVRK